jgi:hypothetical protein
MPWHFPHRGHYPLIQHGFANLIARQISVDGNHLDHVPPQDRQVALVHGFHDNRVPIEPLAGQSACKRLAHPE